MSSPGTAGQEAIAARRGDLAIVQQHHSGAGQGRGPYDTFTVGQVTSITRGGQVRVIRPPACWPARPTASVGRRRART